MQPTYIPEIKSCIIATNDAPDGLNTLISQKGTALNIPKSISTAIRRSVPQNNIVNNLIFLVLYNFSLLS